MKKFLTVFLVLLSFVCIGAKQYLSTDKFSDSTPFVLMNFDEKSTMNSLNGSTGIFDFDPNDQTAYARVGFVQDVDVHKTGYQMKISYSVESLHPAFNGWWCKLNGADLSGFKAIQLSIKGDSTVGFSDIFKIELKDKATKIETVVEDITAQWKQITIPFTNFDGDIEGINWKQMNEFVIVFEDWRLKTKTGRYYIDDIAFVTKTGQVVSFGDIKGVIPNTTKKK